MKHAWVLALSISTFLAGCSKIEPARDNPEPAAKAVPPPAELLAQLALPSLDGGLTGVRQFATAVQPGLGLMISERKIFAGLGMGTLDGAAGDKPAYALVLDPAKHAKPGVLMVGVGELEKLRASGKAAGVEVVDKNGFALLGSKAEVDALAPWAFATLGKAKPVAAPVLIGMSGAILAGYRADIEKLGSTMAASVPGGQADMTEVFDMYGKALLSLLEPSERIELRVEASTAAVALDFVIVPKKGTGLARFIAAQKPADHALLARLPAGETSLVMSGRLLLGPARADLMPLVEKLMTSVYRVPASPELTAFIAKLADSMTGEMAATGSIGAGKMTLTQLMGARDAAKLGAELRKFLAQWLSKPVDIEVAGTKTRISFQPDAVVHDGVTFQQYSSELDVKSLPPASQATVGIVGGKHTIQTGGWDDVVGMGMDTADVKALVDASRGKGPRLVLPAHITALLDESKARKESLFYYFDFGSIVAATLGKQLAAPAGLAMSLGFADGLAHARLGVRTDDVKVMMKLANP